MEAWDADAADAAVAGLCRGNGAAETMEPIWRMAVRDQRNIGHKPIFAAQSWRTLQAIGWEHAEPVLRSLTFGLLDLQGDRPRPLGPYDANLENWRGRSCADWQIGRLDPGATRSLLQTIRQASSEAASAEAARMLNQGVAPGALWDAVVLSAGELMMSNPGIVSIHATTAANSLHYIFQASGDDLTRRLALLQAVGWQPLYRDRTKRRGPWRSIFSRARSRSPWETRPSARSLRRSTTIAAGPRRRLWPISAMVGRPAGFSTPPGE